VQVAAGLACVRGVVRRRPHELFGQERAHQARGKLRKGERRLPDRGQPEGRAHAAPGVVERDLRRGGDDGEIAVTDAQLGERRAGARLAPDRPLDLLEAFVRPDRGRHRAGEERCRVERPFPL
jgi:hypothetical protein